MEYTQTALERAKNIKLLILDVDGVLTDGTIQVGAQGELFKTFNVKDGLGITLAKKWGIKTAIITGRESTMVARRSKELGIDALFQNRKDKIPAFEELLEQFQILPEETAYVGDDLFDLSIMMRVGLPATVRDGCQEVKDIALLESDYPGGGGAVRQIIEFILKAQGKWECILDQCKYGHKKLQDQEIQQ